MAHSFGTVLLCVGRHGVEMPAETLGTPTYMVPDFLNNFLTCGGLG